MSEVKYTFEKKFKCPFGEKESQAQLKRTRTSGTLKGLRSCELLEEVEPKAYCLLVQVGRAAPLIGEGLILTSEDEMS